MNTQNIAKILYMEGIHRSTKTSLICWGSSACHQKQLWPTVAWTLQESCGIWHQDVSSRSFKSCKRSGATVDRTCCSSTFRRCSIRLRLRGALSGWKRPLPSGNTGAPGQQIEVHMNARTHRVSQQNIAQSITLPLLVCLLSIMHHGAPSPLGKWWTDTRPRDVKKTGLIRAGYLLPFLQGPVPTLACPL